MKKDRMNKKLIQVVFFVSALVVAISGIAFASSEGGGVHNAWLTVDTWKVLNFGVLVIGVFLIARKP
ncbi:MAG: hypothetical protein HOJ48_06420, partial [Desulfobacula sp.]|nr:hypothetical protein [Desulfobacula sp.]